MNKFDKIFKQKLSHAHTEVRAHNWDKIASRLDQADAIKPRIWPYRLAMTGMAIVLLIVGSTWISNSYQSNEIENISTNTVTKSTSIDNASNTQNVITYSETSNQIVNSATSIVESGEFVESSQIDKVNGSSLFSQRKVNKTKGNKGSQVNKTSSSSIGKNADANEPLPMTGLKYSNIQISPLLSTSIDPNISKDNFLISPLEMITLPRIDFKPSSLLNYGRKIKSKPSNKTVHACPFTLEGHNKSLEIYISHDYIDKSLSSSAEFVDIVTSRENSESTMYSFSAGFRFGYKIAPRVNIHLGANYSRMNEKFSYVDPESVQERTITIKDYIYENGKIIDSIVTTEIIKLPGTSTIRKQNSFTSFDIPILGRFTILGNRNLSLSAITGPIFNVSYGHKGMIIGNNSQPIDISDNQVYKPQLGVRLYGGVSLAYHLAGDLDFVFEPHARVSFDDVNKDKYPIAQRHQTFGIHTGLRYKF